MSQKFASNNLSSTTLFWKSVVLVPSEYYNDSGIKDLGFLLLFVCYCWSKLIGRHRIPKDTFLDMGINNSIYSNNKRKLVENQLVNLMLVLKRKRRGDRSFR